MSTYNIIHNITISSDGPIAEGNLIHLRQGDMDGACGPYCMMMCLLILGVIGRSEALAPDNLDGRTSIGKLWAYFREFKAFFSEGTTIDDLEKLLSIFKRHLSVESCPDSGLEARKFVFEHLTNDHPVVLGIHGAGLAHWVVIVGWEDVESDGIPERFLLLDPGLESPRTSAWNAVIDLASVYGRYPYNYWDGQQQQYVSLNGAVAIY